MLGKPVFFDPTGKRARLLRAVAWVAGTLSTIVIVLFAAMLVIVHRPEDKSFDRQLSAHISMRLGPDLLTGTCHHRQQRGQA